jgi:hypothetical protein
MREADERRNDVAVDVGAGRLHDEDVGPADVLVDLERDLRIGKPLQARMAQRNLQEFRDLLGQRPMRAAGENLELPAVHARCGSGR